MITDKWYFGVAGLILLILGWVAVFSGMKYIQQKQRDTKNTEKRKHICMWFIWLVYIGTLFITFDIMKCLVENGILNKWYFLILGGVCLFLGWFSSRLEYLSSHLDMKCFSKQK